MYSETEDPAGPPKPKGGKLTFNPPKSLTGQGGLNRRSALGIQITNMIYADEQNLNDVEESAALVDDLYQGMKKRSLTPLWDGAPEYNAKVMGNKLDQVIAFAIGPMTSLDPFFILRAGGPKGNPIDQVQAALHKFLADARYGLALMEAGSFVARRGRCPVRVTYHGRSQSADGTRTRKAKLKIEPIDIRFARIYPNNSANIEDARLFGYIYQTRVRDIDEMQRAGKYFSDVKIRAGATRLQTMATQEGGYTEQLTNAVYKEDDVVDIFDGILRKDLDNDGFEELYHVRVAKWQNALLRIDPFQLDQSWFADCFFKREAGRYRPTNSVGIDLSDVALFSNDMMNMAIQLTMYNGAPPVFTDGWSMDDEVIQSRPGEVRTIEGGGKIFSNQGTLQANGFKDLYEMAGSIADECAKVSQNGLGANLPSGTTATEAAQIAQGQNTGIKGYANQFAYGCIDIAKIAMELLWRNFHDWYPDYSDVLPNLSQDDFKQDFWYEVNGQDPVDSPAVTMQQIQGFVMLLGQVAQLDPTFLQQNTDVLISLLRSMLEASNIPNKESILPQPEELAAQAQQQKVAQLQQMIAQYGQQQQNQGAGQPSQPGPNAGPVSVGGVGVPQGPMAPGGNGGVPTAPQGPVGNPGAGPAGSAATGLAALIGAAHP